MMEYADFIAKRIVSLRMQKGVSARDMSLSLGQSESYINKIENGKALPSMQGFFYICDYFRITPKDFFDTQALSPTEGEQLASRLKMLTPTQQTHLLCLIDDLIERNFSEK